MRASYAFFFVRCAHVLVLRCVILHRWDYAWLGSLHSERFLLEATVSLVSVPKIVHKYASYFDGRSAASLVPLNIRSPFSIVS